MDKVGDVYNLTQWLLNDVGQDVYTDAYLFEPVKSTYRRLQRDMAVNSAKVLEETVVLVPDLTPITQTTIDNGTSPSLPADLLVPYELWEKPAGGTTRFQPLTKKVGPLEDFDQSQNLCIWTWYSNRINLIGATQAITVRLSYEKLLPALVDATSDILINGSLDALAAGAAALAASQKGAADMAARAEGMYLDRSNKLISDMVQAETNIMVRRLPFRCR